MIRTLLLSTAILATPAVALAAGDGSSTPPKPTATTTECTSGKIFDATSKTCVDAQESRLDDKTLYGAVREFAYAGQFENAQRALAAMSDQEEDRVLTYWGFTHRKLGEVETGMRFYELALAVNPDNFLARSYMGQAYVEQGDMVLARAQLTEIRTRGGRGTWPEFALRQAIESGRGYNY